MYIFGDSTTFPLRENFLDTLMATVRASSALFALECDLSKSLAQVQRARVAADAELANLEKLQNELVQTLRSAQGVASTQAAQLMSQAALKVLNQTRAQVTTGRDQTISKATPKNVSGRVRQILSSFLLTNQLPHTRWSFYWRVGKDGQPCADVRGIAKDVSVDFKTQITDEQIWATPIPVSSLRSVLSIQVPVWTRKHKGTQTQNESLADYEIMEVDSSQSRQRLVLRRNAKAKHSVMITLADPAQSAPTVALLDEYGEVAGEKHHLLAGEIGEVSKLWNLLLENLTPLVKSRSSLTKLAFGNRSIESISHPSEVAETLLQQVAPLAREIRLRSRVPGELILKRATTKGRREEIFMSREDLQKQYESLPDEYRRVFDAMGLGNESTCDFVTMLGGKLDHRQRPRSQRALNLDNTMDASLDSVLLEIEAA